MLAEAQRLGLAEPDPSFDVGGMDAAYKLSILSSLAFHARVPVDKVFVEGIEAVTPRTSARARSWAIPSSCWPSARSGIPRCRCGCIPPSSRRGIPLQRARQLQRGLHSGRRGGRPDALWPRGGDLPTASAIISISSPPPSTPITPTAPSTTAPEASPDLSFQENWTCGFFVRLTVRDQPGVLSRIAGIFSQQNVSIASMVQKGHGADEVPLIFVTHDTHEQGMERAIGQIRQLEQVLAVNSVIRVES